MNKQMKNLNLQPKIIVSIVLIIAILLIFAMSQKKYVEFEITNHLKFKATD